jgi:hypothetical protein
MFFEEEKPDVQRDLDYTIEKGLHQTKILALLRKNLPEFSKDFRIPIATKDVNTNLEDYISQELQFFLNNKVEQSGYLFGFQAKGPDIFARQFGAGIHGLTLLFIEAKRLPPTNSQDYVKNGIGRFKKEKHGKQHNIGAMLGYVQDKDFDHWYHKINVWIDDLISKAYLNPRWEKQDKLDRTRIEDFGEYKSTHSRINEKPITLYHFWINLCTNN